MLNSLNKKQLIELSRRMTGKVGDSARTTVGEYVTRLTESFTEEQIGAAIGELGLIMAGAAPLQQQSQPQQSQPLIPAFQPSVVAKKTLGELFGVRGARAGFMVDQWNDPMAPKLDKLYRFDTDMLHSAIAAIQRGQNVWAAGPAGTGKTEFWKNVAAGLGRGFVRVSLDAGIERYELIGGERMRHGQTVYEHGIVLRAMQRAGCIILLDEIATARAEHLTAMHAVLEPDGCITIAETSQVVARAVGQVFAAADNSNGRGDVTGNYGAVREQSVALMDRFSKIIEFAYLEPAIEIKVLCDRTGCSVELATIVVGFMNVCRKQAESGQIDAPPSLRQAIYLAGALMDGQKPRLAFEECIVNRAPGDVREVLQQAWKGNVDEKLIAEAAGATTEVEAE
jgi:MoxR-like ATPase